jgi:Icc-related predicted phosphoesterase
VTILVIADDDAVMKAVPDIRADVLVSCGDVTDDTILAVGARTGIRTILAVKGNHDSAASFPPPVINLHLETHSVRDVTFGGFCGCWKYKPVGHHLFDEAEVGKHLDSFPRVDVFVAHNSPRSVHDRDDDVHMGFSSFTSYIVDQRPRMFLHGHQHVNAKTTVGTTQVIGVCGYRYVVLQEQ